MSACPSDISKQLRIDDVGDVRVSSQSELTTAAYANDGIMLYEKHLN
jgi:hypothetical protein